LFFQPSFGRFKPIDLPHHFVRVEWPVATSFFDKLIDDSPQFLFFSIIEHNIWDWLSLRLGIALGVLVPAPKALGDSDKARKTS
jgi:hypothetical protein